MDKLTLRQIMMLVVVLGIVGPALILGYVLLHDRYSQEVDLRVRRPMTNYAEMLAQSSSGPLWSFDHAIGSQIVDSVMKNTEVVSIVIEADNHEKFVSHEIPSRRVGDLLREQRPIFYANSQIGTVKIEVSAGLIKQGILLDFFKLVAALVLQVALSVGLILMLLERRMVRPIMHLRLSAAKLASGRLDEAVTVRRQDELGKLAQDLDSMRISLGTTLTERDQLNASLEQRVQERTQALQASNEELSSTLDQLQASQRALVQKEKLASLGALVSGVAHELNTPLGVSVTIASSFQDQNKALEEAIAHGLTRSALNSFHERYVNGTALLVQNLQRAATLVTRFKQVSTDRASEQRRKFQLKDVVEEVIFINAPSFDKTPHKITLDIGEGLAFDSYPGPLGQVITNLIQNAFVHAFDPHTSGTLHISARSPVMGAIQIKVHDNGKGIPGSDIQHIFDPFFTTKLGQGGSGLGLNIVYNIVTATLGGDIVVDSQVGSGTTFTMVLPNTAPERRRKGSPARA
ncbi:sensor histidine kinase [Rhodoferax aquaticus]|uniref:sensor histidine kinase n=1 Tax=Rhodoferax aquaticus TaxID=2527691 RepID=UPI00143CD707|nr:ATP-binding protein [Rhodoferax aquaticus]